MKQTITAKSAKVAQSSAKEFLCVSLRILGELCG
jgi:hypothetical protein